MPPRKKVVSAPETPVDTASVISPDTPLDTKSLDSTADTSSDTPTDVVANVSDEIPVLKEKYEKRLYALDILNRLGTVDTQRKAEIAQLINIDEFSLAIERLRILETGDNEFRQRIINALV